MSSLSGLSSAETLPDKYRIELPELHGKTVNTQRVFHIQSATLDDQGVYTFSCADDPSLSQDINKFGKNRQKPYLHSRE